MYYTAASRYTRSAAGHMCQLKIGLLVMVHHAKRKENIATNWRNFKKLLSSSPHVYVLLLGTDLLKIRELEL